MNYFLFLGTSGSMGVPVVGCSCSICRSSNPRNRRLRPSGLLHLENKAFLIDVGPDFREQALINKIDRLDGLLLTHTHFDHLGGVDDLKAFYFLQKKKIPCLLSQETFDELKVRYHYLMRPLKDGTFNCTQLDFHLLEKDFGSILFEGIRFHYMSYFQAGMKVTGFRQKEFAYVSDIREYTDEVITELQGVKTLVLSAPRYTKSEFHFGIDEAISFSRKVGAKKTWLTHIAHDLEHEETNCKLPSDVQLSYDGLKITL